MSPTTKKLEEVNETNVKLGEVIEQSQPENVISQPAIKHTPSRLLIE